MAFAARIDKDSISPDGVRLITFEVTHPRYILAEVNTHRMLSRNSASSRAIPVVTMLQRLRDDPYTPVYWGKNKKGMQAEEELDETAQKLCLEEWLGARDDMVKRVTRLHELGLHKQDANRLLEPFMWHTALITATEWDNFFHLRNHPEAHPAFQTVAAMMQELYENSVPEVLSYGEWHTPMITDDELFPVGDGPAEQDAQVAWETQRKVSIGRCARVSFLTHDGKRDLQADVDLHDKMRFNGHMSPYEHAARPATEDDIDLAMVRWSDCFVGSHGGPRLPPRVDQQWFGNFRGCATPSSHRT